MDYFKLQELAEVMMSELADRGGTLVLARILRQNGLNARKLADMGFSESYLYGLGLNVEEVAAG